MAQAGTDIDLACRCGAFTARLDGASPRHGCRVICHCKDCRAFAMHLGAKGILDENGGSELYQTLPARLKVTAGKDQLRALRLSPKGMVRWYTGCCGTPLGNTLHSEGWYFLSLSVACIPEAARAPLGPLRGAFFAKDAPAGTHPPADFGKLTLLSGAFGRHFAAWLGLAPRGTPFFENGKPVATPEILSLEARRAAETAWS